MRISFYRLLTRLAALAVMAITLHTPLQAHDWHLEHVRFGPLEKNCFDSDPLPVVVSATRNEDNQPSTPKTVLTTKQRSFNPTRFTSSYLAFSSISNRVAQAIRSDARQTVVHWSVDSLARWNSDWRACDYSKRPALAEATPSQPTLASVVSRARSVVEQRVERNVSLVLSDFADAECQLSDELQSMRVAKQTGRLAANGIASWFQSSNKIVVRLANAAASQPVRQPLYTTPRFVVHTTDLGKTFVLDMATAADWNLIRPYGEPAPADLASPTIDDAVAELTAESVCPIYIALRDAAKSWSDGVLLRSSEALANLSDNPRLLDLSSWTSPLPITSSKNPESLNNPANLTLWLRNATQLNVAQLNDLFKNSQHLQQLTR